MKSWLLSVCIVILLTSVLGLIVPEGKMGNYVKSFFSILVLIVIVSPVIKLINSDFAIGELVDANSIYIKEDYLSFINDKKITSLKSDCEEILNKYGIYNAEIDVEYFITEDYIFSIKKVNIFLDNAVINSDSEHINIIESVKEAVSVLFNIEKDAVILYE